MSLSMMAARSMTTGIPSAVHHGALHGGMKAWN
jgi:hypothetical protein